MSKFVKHKQSLFIYDRKEMVVLVLLVFMVGLFTFTLGVHLGKRVGGKVLNLNSKETHLAREVPDQIPNRQEISEQSKMSQEALEETLGQSLQDEIKKTGIKLDESRQVNLPEEAKTVTKGATTLESPKKKLIPPPKTPQTSVASKKSEKVEGKFTLQIGSFPSLDEAKREIATLQKANLQTFLREAEVKGKGKWYRLYLGGFPSKGAAEQAGSKYRAEHKISSFIVAKFPS